jgi:hypothetical protein
MQRGLAGLEISNKLAGGNNMDDQGSIILNPKIPDPFFTGP